MKRRLVYTVATLGACAIYGVGAWFAAGGDETWIAAFIFVLTLATIWTDRSTLRI
jgi:hypothetical protein